MTIHQSTESGPASAGNQIPPAVLMAISRSHHLLCNIMLYTSQNSICLCDICVSRRFGLGIHGQKYFRRAFVGSVDFPNMCRCKRQKGLALNATTALICTPALLAALLIRMLRVGNWHCCMIKFSV